MVRRRKIENVFERKQPTRTATVPPKLHQIFPTTHCIGCKHTGHFFDDACVHPLKEEGICPVHFKGKPKIVQPTPKAQPYLDDLLKRLWEVRKEVDSIYTEINRRVNHPEVYNPKV